LVFCSNCGRELAGGAKFCLNCGAPVTPSVLPQSTTVSRPARKREPGRNIAFFVVVLILMVGAAVIFPRIYSPGTQTAEEVQSSTMQYDVTVYYSNQVASSIGAYNQPTAGNEFLIVTLNIQDFDAPTFDVNVLYFHLIANNVKYDYDAATFSLSNPLKAVQLLPGGSTSGSIAFQVPNTVSDYTITYEPWVTNPATINWVPS